MTVGGRTSSAPADCRLLASAGRAERNEEKVGEVGIGGLCCCSLATVERRGEEADLLASLAGAATAGMMSGEGGALAVESVASDLRFLRFMKLNLLVMPLRGLLVVVAVAGERAAEVEGGGEEGKVTGAEVARGLLGAELAVLSCGLSFSFSLGLLGTTTTSFSLLLTSSCSGAALQSGIP